uniref:Lymphocyte antigen 75 n=1 Tax=Latimeria chalumnae TaxID=7897 RepID=H3A293_LATCH
GNDAFFIRHKNSSKCLKVENSQITAADCKQSTDTLLWKWVSQHRLFNLGAKQCLGLSTSKPKSLVKMFECDENVILWWKCNEGMLYSASHYTLALVNGSVTANTVDTRKKDEWDKNVCEQRYHEIYTRNGNSHGKLCEFPFKFNGTWYHDCTTDGSENGQQWCATTSDYDSDRKWGICLKPETECSINWEVDSKSQNCYQFNFQSMLSWNEARISCVNQGGDLLSITSKTELNYVLGKTDIPDILWSGLNQLDISSGWQWSDGTPLAFVSWDEGMPDSSILEGLSCGVMNSNMKGRWQNYICEAKLPYICKKQLNDSEQTFLESWRYSETVCDPGWLPYNGFCYLSKKTPATWENASTVCTTENSTLISIHSLADVELIIIKLHNGNLGTEEDTWTGLKSADITSLFKWSDKSDVSFTYWDRNEPNLPFNTTSNCVSYSGKLGKWKVTTCSKVLPYVCKKRGKVENETQSDTGCPQEKDWKRHGDFCYKVNTEEVLFGRKCDLTITNRFEQEFINSLIRQYGKAEGKYFWTSLQDGNSTGEYTWVTEDKTSDPVAYVNWNALQPAFPGGCVAMTTGKSLGKWEVKDCKNFKALSICKKSIGSSKQPEIIPIPDAPCSSGWYSKEGLLYCYKVFHRERIVRKRTWEEAERFCEALGAHLPSFSHEEELQFLDSILKDTVSDERWIWVGLNKRNPGSRGSWEWSDNRPVSTVLPYDSSEDDYTIRDCVALKTQREFWRRHFWMTLFPEKYITLKPFLCDVRLEWICQIPRGKPPKRQSWYPPIDENKLHGPPLIIDGSEFWFVADTQLTYQEAALYCESNGSKLATVKSNAALKGVWNKLENVSKDENQKWWLHSVEILEYHRPSFFPFYSFRHFPPYMTAECLHVTPRSFFKVLSKQENCEERLPFICEKHNVSALERHSHLSNVTEQKCPEDWVAFEDKCFVSMKPRYLTFSKANEHCQSLGGTLPSISSQIEQDFIISILSEAPEKIWIGLQFSANDKENTWVDGLPLTYGNFNPLLRGKIKTVYYNYFDRESRKQCAILLNNPASSFVGTWDFTSCSDLQYASVCQRYRDLKDTKTQSVVNETLTFQDHQYKIIQKNLTWYNALGECMQYGMQLVSISNQYQQSFLAVTVNALGYPVWIGLSSKDDGIHYSWSDGTHVVYSRWSEDDVEQVEECVYLDINGFWKTADCEKEQQGAICYNPLTDVTSKKSNVESVKCPHKIQSALWMPFKTSCYTFLVSRSRWESVSVQESHHVCRKLQTDPSSYVLNIRNEEENNFVVEQLRPYRNLAQWVWLGLLYDENLKSLRWYDETFVHFSKWSNGRPDVHDKNLFVGMNLDGSWDLFNDISRSQTAYFQQHSIVVCKIEMEDKGNYSVPLPDNIQYGNDTYKVIPKKLNWYDVLRVCKRNGGDLVSIHNEAQQLFLEDIIRKDGFPLWIGLSSQDGTESNFEWSDGSDLDYKPWEFENSNSTGNCVFIDTKGIWKRAKCTSIQNGAICRHTSLKNVKTQLQKTKSSSQCPQSKNTSKWILYKGYCYGFDMTLYNFSVFNMNEAKRYCQKLDPYSSILTIMDADENAFITKHITEEKAITGKVWLGISQDSKSNIVHWLDGSDLTYSNWENGTPRMIAGDDCAVIMSTKGTWATVSCQQSQSRLVCKVSARRNQRTVAIVLAVLFVMLLVAGLTWYLFKKKLRWSSFSSQVRYERTIDGGDTTSMIMSD